MVLLRTQPSVVDPDSSPSASLTPSFRPTQSSSSPDQTNSPTTWWRPPLGLNFQWQLNGELDTSIVADVLDIDLFDQPKETVAALHQQGKRVVCYINVGAWEDWRPDKDIFPEAIIGRIYAGYPDERWLDIRQLDLLGPILAARFDLCQAKGFDAVEPDNIDGFEQETGFPLTAADQLRFNRWLAGEAHARGLAIALKNDGSQISELLDVFDFALVEDCVDQGFCGDFQPFVMTGKPVIIVDYTDRMVTISQICAEARRLGYTGLLKQRSLDAWRETCL
ncbi:endo alpha-1,4 polygalactosaminidase [Candidatus Berkelbacteria bacterium]|nr:endo alpha-1,4 polygalactosaminidase [Candidatus Berkelbacteria bacterium]